MLKTHSTNLQQFNAIGLFIIIVLIALPASTWTYSVGNPLIYFKYDTPPGQVFYVLSKLTGLYAIVLIWMQASLALLHNTPLKSQIKFWNLKFHKTLGLLATAFLVSHAALFIAAVSIRKDNIALNLLIPQFDNSFYAFSVALGVIGLYGLLATVALGFYRAHSTKLAKRLHWLAIPSFILVFVHSLLIGTETRDAAMLSIYVFMGVLFLGALIYRITTRLR